MTKDRASLAEQYECATVTSNLGLPHGDGAGAQGILAAAAWNEVALGSDLRRLRVQWENARPRKKVPRPVKVLKDAGLNKEQAKRQHNRELVQCALTYSQEKKALKQRIPEYAQALDVLLTKAVVLGIEEPEAKAILVLDRWLEAPLRVPEGAEEAKLWRCITDSLNAAKQALVQGMRGHTRNERGEE